MTVRPNLATVLWIKIAVTAALWIAPLLLFPRSVFVWIGFPPPEPMLFVRLLGAAYLALTLGYGLGLRDLAKGGTASAARWTGIASNGTACAILIGFGLSGATSDWGTLARIYLGFSAVATGALTIALALGKMDQER